jgi:hypothetical protein
MGVDVDNHDSTSEGSIGGILRPLVRWKLLGRGLQAGLKNRALARNYFDLLAGWRESRSGNENIVQTWRKREFEAPVRHLHDEIFLSFGLVNQHESFGDGRAPGGVRNVAAQSSIWASDGGLTTCRQAGNRQNECYWQAAVHFDHPSFANSLGAA